MSEISPPIQDFAKTELLHQQKLSLDVESVSIGEVIPRSEVKEIGLYNGFFEWMNERMHKFALLGQKLGLRNDSAEAQRYMSPRSKLPENTATSIEMERPDFLRAAQLELNQKVMTEIAQLPDGADMEREEKINHLMEEMKNLDSISRQYLGNAREVKVKFKDLGEVSSEIVKIESPVEGSKKKRLVIYGGGYGTDKRGIAPAIQAIASLGRDVVGVTFPDSYNGTVTDRFADAVADSPGMEAHAAYFKAVVAKIKEENPDREIELIGNSTFAIAIADMCQDQKFVEENDIAAAVGVGAAGATEMTRMQQKLQYIGEVWELRKRRHGLTQYANVIGIRERAKDADQDRIRSRVWDQVMARTNVRLDTYDKARVKDGGHFYFVTGGKDDVTKDYQRFTKDIGQRIIVHNPEGKHQDANSDAMNLFRRLFDAEQKNESASPAYRQVFALLRDNGILEKTDKEVSGEPIVWNAAKVQRLADDLELGERTFVVVPGEEPGSETLKTQIKTVFAHITVVTPEGKFKLRQFVQEGTMEADLKGDPIPDTEKLGSVNPKVAKSSVSGKLNVKNGETPDECLRSEIEQELGLTSDQYEVKSKPEHNHSINTGRAYPGLLTETDSYEYSDIELHPDAYKPEYIEITKPIYDAEQNIYHLKKNIFKWEKVSDAEAVVT